MKTSNSINGFPPWSLLLICLLTPNVDGAENAAEEKPDMALLEFLGSYETVDGAWLDPSSLSDTEDSKSESAEAKRNERP